MKEYGEAVMRKNSPERFQQARLIFDTMGRLVLGRITAIETATAGIQPNQQTVDDLYGGFPAPEPTSA